MDKGEAVKKGLTVSLAITLAAAGFVGTTVSAATPGAGSCADASHPGGEWRSYGGNPQNHRNQPAEDKLNPSTAANVAKKWSFNAADAEQSGVLSGGTFQNTPVVADGCVYLASNTGFIFALNADTGERVWSSDKMPGSPAGQLVGGVITGSPLVANDLVYVGVSQLNDPKLVALEQATGDIRWIKSIMDPAKNDNAYRTTTVSGPVLINGMIFQGIMADENSSGARGGFAFLDALSGDLITQQWTISDDEYAHGYRGASVWCTAAADPETNTVYACGGNPASKQQEARFANSLLKIDADKASPTFGKITAAYKGNYDQYYPGLDRQPACDTVPTTLVWSPTCVQLDLDFGASPNLFTIQVNGQPVKVLGDLQKSGIYHTVYADNMQLAWSAVVGVPGPTWNAASPAVGNDNVFVAATPPGQMWGLSKDRGRYRWATPLVTGAPLYFESVSTANGVVYSVDNSGVLHILDAATGVPVKEVPMAQDVGAPISSQSSHGVAIARNAIYAAAGSYVVAYS